jgi:fatty-acyl-CoA synthase
MALTLRRIEQARTRVRSELWAARHVARAGIFGFVSPSDVAAIVRAVRRYGALGAAPTIAAIRYRDRVAMIDERGALTFEELDSQTNAIANHWRRRGLAPGDRVAILARNHRGLLQAAFAAAKCGAQIVFLNTDFGRTQVREVTQREGADLLVYDDEYHDAVTDLPVRHGHWRAWTDTPGSDTLDAAIDSGDSTPPPPTGTESKIIILTSGTTGPPKGAVRSEPRSLIPIAGLLSKAPFRGREVTECCVPMFHALGFAHAMLAVLLGSTLVVRRRFDPQLVLASLAQHQVSAVIVVPVMLRRMIEATAVAPDDGDLSALRIIFVAGSQLGAALCTRALDAFGPVIYNLYGSTEVAYATVATPDDLIAEPGCAGGVVQGARVKILDTADREVPPGETGRIFVGNRMQFEGYTGGGGKASVDGLMASGDVGHFDAGGRLFIDGRDDDMIVSGGENVFPGEVEEALGRHPDIVEAAAIGVPDESYGQRLQCFVVTRTGSTLTEQDVKDYVKDSLARFKVPREVRFLEALPRNPTGKVLKRQLSSESAQP